MRLQICNLISGLVKSERRFICILRPSGGRPILIFGLFCSAELESLSLRLNLNILSRSLHAQHTRIGLSFSLVFIEFFFFLSL